jgi:hypothetical protein
MSKICRMNRPRVSLITVCMNAAATIDSCLFSIARQSYRDFEHVVVDGASTDGTLAILEKHRSEIGTLISEPDRGLYDAMNKGIAAANGEFVLFMNADDTFASRHSLRDAILAIDKLPDGDVYYGSIEVRSDLGQGFGPVIHTPASPDAAAEEMVTGCLPHQATLARRAVFDRTGPFDLRWRRHADYDWWLKVMADPTLRLRRIDTVVASFALGGASSELAKGQPEVFAIQNASMLYRSAEWDRRRIELLQKAWLEARIEAAALREAAAASGLAPPPLPWKARLAAILPRPVLRAVQGAKRRLSRIRS